MAINFVKKEKNSHEKKLTKALFSCASVIGLPLGPSREMRLKSP